MGTWALTGLPMSKKAEPTATFRGKAFTLIEKDTLVSRLVQISFIRAELSVHHLLG